MFAGGADEHAIAEALFVTPRSVQATLQSVRDRLAVTSRGELGAALAAAR
jgi:DNA-binding NarL/FixJ family response regulator